MKRTYLEQWTDSEGNERQELHSWEDTPPVSIPPAYLEPSTLQGGRLRLVCNNTLRAEITDPKAKIDARKLS